MFCFSWLDVEKVCNIKKHRNICNVKNIILKYGVTSETKILYALNKDVTKNMILTEPKIRQF